MSEEKFWLRLWQSCIAGVVLMIVAIGGCTAHSNSLVAEMVANGANPIDANCSIWGSAIESPSATCVIRAQATGATDANR